MLKFICIRSGKNCRSGEWFISEGIGDPLHRAELKIENGRYILRQTSLISIPFETLAPYIVEQGFNISRELLENPSNLSSSSQAKEIEDFQRSVEDIIEPEVEKRQQAADPSSIGESGIVVPSTYRKKDETD